MKHTTLLVTALVLVHLLALNSPAWSESLPNATVNEQLTAAGSGVNLGITRLLAEAFTKQHPNITIEVPGSIGTRGAIKAAADGAIALGLTSRPLKEEEKELGLTAKPYARVAIVIGTHAGVTDDTISSKELLAIFAGTKTQ